MKRKIFSTILVVSLVFGLCACGNKANNNEASTQKETNGVVDTDTESMDYTAVSSYDGVFGSFDINQYANTIDDTYVHVTMEPNANGTQSVLVEFNAEKMKRNEYTYVKDGLVDEKDNYYNTACSFELPSNMEYYGSLITNNGLYIGALFVDDSMNYGCSVYWSPLVINAYDCDVNYAVEWYNNGNSGVILGWRMVGQLDAKNNNYIATYENGNSDSLSNPFDSAYNDCKLVSTSYDTNICQSTYSQPAFNNVFETSYGLTNQYIQSFPCSPILRPEEDSYTYGAVTMYFYHNIDTATRDVSMFTDEMKAECQKYVDTFKLINPIILDGYNGYSAN